MISGSEELIRPQEASPMPQHRSGFHRKWLFKAMSGMIFAWVA